MNKEATMWQTSITVKNEPHSCTLQRPTRRQFSQLLHDAAPKKFDNQSNHLNQKQSLHRSTG
jgi:hypothetical protein